MLPLQNLQRRERVAETVNSEGSATSEQVMLDAVETTRPDFIIAPMLKKPIPEAVWLSIAMK